MQINERQSISQINVQIYREIASQLFYFTMYYYSEKYLIMIDIN